MVFTLSSLAHPGATRLHVLPGKEGVFSPGWVPDLSGVEPGAWPALWCLNPSTKSALVPWDDEAAWETLEANLRRLQMECKARDIAGVAWDAELYRVKRGRMWDWPRGGRNRGLQWRKAFAGMELALYGPIAALQRQPGFEEFFGGGLLMGDRILNEDYASGPAQLFKGRGVRNMRGLQAQGGKLLGRPPIRGEWWVWDSDGRGWE